MRILITGGGGSIGSELVRQLSLKHEIYILDNNETACFDLIEELKQDGRKVTGRIGDVRDAKVVSEVFRVFKPKIVYHAAALKHVTPMEWNPEEAVATNVIGTINVLQEAKKNKVKHFVFISTDKVVNSKCIMGQTKKLAETIVVNAGYTAVRFGNVLRSRGSVLEIWERQIAENKPITITDMRMERYTMTIPQAVELVIKATKYKGIVILDMGDKKKIGDILSDYLRDKLLPLTYPVKMIGIRDGESLTENLMTEEEKKVAIKKDKYYFIKK